MFQQDNDGWTIVPVTDPIYVSSLGSDAADGKTNSTAVKTLAKAIALCTAGKGHSLMLRNGDVWNEFLPNPPSGASPETPFFVGTWSRTGPRATIQAPTYLCNMYARQNVVLQNLELKQIGRHPESYSLDKGVEALPMGLCSNILIEGCDISGGTFGLTFQGQPNKHVHDFAMRRNVVHDNWKAGGMSSGIFINYVDGRIVYEQNIFYHNGWREIAPAVPPEMHNHGIYNAADNVAASYIGNAFIMNAAHGLQARSGGVVQKNLFLRNAIGMSYGVVNGQATPKAGGVTGEISINLFVGNRDLGKQGQRGRGIEIANANGVWVRNNQFYHDTQKWDGSFAINLVPCEGDHADVSVGIHNVRVEGNKTSDWDRSFFIDWKARFDASNKNGNVSGISLKGNNFTMVYGPPTVMESMIPAPAIVKPWLDDAASALGNWQSYIDNLLKQSPARWLSTLMPDMYLPSGDGGSVNPQSSSDDTFTGAKK